jgi:hypothetical protein
MIDDKDFLINFYEDMLSNAEILTLPRLLSLLDKRRTEITSTAVSEEEIAFIADEGLHATHRYMLDRIYMGLSPQSKTPFILNSKIDAGFPQINFQVGSFYLRFQRFG